MRLASVTGGSVVAPDGVVSIDIGIIGDRIAGLGTVSGGPSFGANGLTVLPGFIDIHTHGGGGHSFFTKDPARLASYSAWAATHGVTSYLASLVGDDPDETRSMLSALARSSPKGGATCLGFHLEGPFINPVRRGAFPESTLRPPNAEEFVSYQAAADGRIRQLTLAPELPGGMAVLRAVVASGAVASIGHTDATFAEATAAFAAGASNVTHLFNAMRPLHHREGGPIAATFASGATCELIFDTVHVGPEVLRLAYRLLGSRRTVVVTDNLYLAGAGQASGAFAGETVSTSGNVAVREDATIVGSLLPMDGHLRNVVTVLGVGPHEAARLCATNAAAAIGETERGEVAPGKIADLVILDASMDVVATICAGDVAYLRAGDEGRYRP